MALPLGRPCFGHTSMTVTGETPQQPAAQVPSPPYSEIVPAQLT